MLKGIDGQTGKPHTRGCPRAHAPCAARAPPCGRTLGSDRPASSTDGRTGTRTAKRKRHPLRLDPGHFRASGRRDRRVRGGRRAAARGEVFDRAAWAVPFIEGDWRLSLGRRYLVARCCVSMASELRRVLAGPVGAPRLVHSSTTCVIPYCKWMLALHGASASQRSPWTEQLSTRGIPPHIWANPGAMRAGNFAGPGSARGRCAPRALCRRDDDD